MDQALNSPILPFLKICAEFLVWIRPTVGILCAPTSTLEGTGASTSMFAMGSPLPQRGSSQLRPQTSSPSARFTPGPGDQQSGRSSAWSERRVWDAEAGGSNPLVPTILVPLDPRLLRVRAEAS